MRQIGFVIDEKTISIGGEYNPFGKLHTRVLRGEISFLLAKTPLQLLDDSLTYIGNNLSGATAGAKAILGNQNKCPIIVNPYIGICLFPDHSPHKADCIWFNPDHIMKTSAHGNKTEVQLSNGHSIMVDCKLSSFNHKIQTANLLRQVSWERGHHPGTMTFYLEPKKGTSVPK